MKPLFALALCASSLVFGRAVRADDAAISYGGSPSALKGTGTVAMQSEVVLLDIGPKEVKADCQFVFKNSGPACTVRMGFPDGDSQREQEQEEAGSDKPLLKSSFSSFRSWVDGQPVATKLVPGKDFDWHTKTVSFPANGARSVREVYTVELGVDDGGVEEVNTAYYVLHTGSSWRGPIGRVEVIARFRRSRRAHPTQGKAFQDIFGRSFAAMGEKAVYLQHWTRPDQEVVVYEGPGTPQVDHNILHWVRTNIRPTEKDDVFLRFKMMK